MPQAKKKKIDPPGSKKKSGKPAPTGNQGMKKRKKKKPLNTASAPAGYSRRTRMDMAAKEALSGGVAKRKKKKTKAGKAGYGPQNRTGIAPKKRKVKTTGPVKKAVKYNYTKAKKAKLSSKPLNKRQLALKKRADLRDKKKKVKTVAQLRKENKIQF